MRGMFGFRSMPVGPSNPCLHNGLGAVPQTTEDGAQENKLKEIYCTHATIPEKFSDGTALLQTLTDMISMQVTGGDVPSLRLVRYDVRTLPGSRALHPGDEKLVL